MPKKLVLADTETGEFDGVVKDQLNAAIVEKVSNDITDDETDIGAALNATIVEPRHVDHAGSGPLSEVGVLGTGSASHLLLGAGHDAPYAQGIGVDHDRVGGEPGVGQTVSVKSPKGIGRGVQLTAESGPEAVGDLVSVVGPGTGRVTEQASGAHGPNNLSKNDYGGTGAHYAWSSADREYAGEIDADGVFTRAQGAPGEEHKHICTVGSAIVDNRYHWSGTPGLWFSSSIVSYSNRLLFQQGGAAAIGAETPQTAIEMLDGNQLGFFGKAPTVRPTVTGSRGGNAALASLLTALDSLGLITDSTTV